MTAALVQSKSGSTVSGATLGVTLDSSPTQGNVLVAIVNSDTTMTSGPSGYTERLAYVSNQGFYVYTKVAGAGESATVTVDPNGGYPTSMAVLEFSGVTDYETKSATAATQGTPGQTSRTSTSLTAAGDAAYIAGYGLTYWGSTGGPTSPSVNGSFTLAQSSVSGTGAGSNSGVYAAYRISSGAQAPTLSWSTSGVSNTAAVVLALTAAGDPTASIPTTAALSATATVTRGKPTYRAAGTLAYSTSGGTSVAPGYPSGLVAGDLLVCFVGQKPTTANGGTCTTPDGWALAGSLEEAGGYGATLGADTGNTNLFCYTKTATGSESDTLSITVGDNNVCWSQILAVEGQTGKYDTAAVTGSDTNGGDVSVTFGSNPGIAAGQLLIAAWCQPTDVTTPSQFTAEVISASDLTVGTAVEISEPDSSVGNDIGGFLAYAYATVGAASAAPVLTATAGGTTTNVRGPAILLRVADLVTATATMPTTAGLAATGDVTAGGSTATIPTTAGLAATGLAERNGTATVPTTSTLAGTGTLGLAGTGTIPTTATLTGTATVERNGTATIPTTSGLTGTGVPERNAATGIPTTATLAGTGLRETGATTAVATTATVTADATVETTGSDVNGTATLPVTVAITATATVERNATTAVATTVALAGTGLAARDAQATVETTAAVTATGLPERHATAATTILAALTATASVDHQATAGIPVTVTVTTTGDAGSRGTVAGAARTPSGPGAATRAGTTIAPAAAGGAGPASAARTAAGPRHADRAGTTLTGA